jgi:hypothetical protein
MSQQSVREALQQTMELGESDTAMNPAELLLVLDGRPLALSERMAA